MLFLLLFCWFWGCLFFVFVVVIFIFFVGFVVFGGGFFVCLFGVLKLYLTTFNTREEKHPVVRS